MGARLLFSFIILSGVLTFAEPIPKILDESAMKDIDPCTDFYQFACGGWLDSTIIPEDRPSVSRQVTALADSVDVNLNKILEEYAKGDFNSHPARYAQKLSDFYESCMAADQNTRTAVALLQEQILNIRQARTPEELAQLIAHLHQLGVSALFNFGSFQDLNDSTQIIGNAGQGGMALGEREYYVSKDIKMIEVRHRYLAYMAKLFNLLGDTKEDANEIAVSVLKTEITLAQQAYSIADYNNPGKINHRVDRQGLKNLAPHFNWDVYFQTLGLSSSALNVSEPEFFSNLDQLLTSIAPKDLQNYLIWQLLNRSAADMGSTFEQVHFDFWESYMNGRKKMLPRWKLCTQNAESSLGYALAEAYIETFDGTAIKNKTESMIAQIKETFTEDLHLLTSGPQAWFDEDTLAEALRKVSSMGQKVGAPDKFLNYDSLPTTSANFLQNSFTVAHFESTRDLNKIGKPVDKSEWDMMPWEVNAYYDRSNNEFVFPFGILQPPSLDLTASDGANFGSFGGGTIGHELTHGFDNNGAQYDSHGNLRNWWSPQTLAQFTQRAQCYIDQADSYRIDELGLNVKGEQTLEENLADQGGVKLGYLALEKILAQWPEGTPWLGKYNERQQYWIGYAQSWCTKSTIENLRERMTRDVHPPSEFRVNAVLMNRPEFARDFNCQAGARMAPINRCLLW